MMRAFLIFLVLCQVLTLDGAAATPIDRCQRLFDGTEPLSAEESVEIELFRMAYEKLLIQASLGAVSLHELQAMERERRLFDLGGDGPSHKAHLRLALAQLEVLLEKSLKPRAARAALREVLRRIIKARVTAETETREARSRRQSAEGHIRTLYSARGQGTELHGAVRLPDGKLATLEYGRQRHRTYIRLVDQATGVVSTPFFFERTYLNALESLPLHPGGPFWIAGAGAVSAFVGTLTSPADQQPVRLGTQFVGVMEISTAPSGKFIAMRRLLGGLTIVEMDRGLERELEYKGIVAARAISERSGGTTQEVVLASNSHGAVLRWEAPYSEPTVVIPRHDTSILAATFSPDGSLLAEIPGVRFPVTEGVRILGIPSGNEVMRFNLPENTSIVRMAFSPDGRFWAGSSESHLFLKDLTTAEPPLALEFPMAASFSFSSAEKLLVVTGSGLVQEIDVASVIAEPTDQAL